MRSHPAHIPVLIGVGQINDRDNGGAGRDSLELMVAAARAADADAGGGWLARCDRAWVVPQISCPGLDLPGQLPVALGLGPQALEVPPVPSGDTPVRSLNDAANAIAAGEARVCLIVGGEALRTAARRAEASGKSPTRLGAASVRSNLRRRYGLVAPADIYPLYENAGRAAWGQTLAEGQAESGAIWSLMSQVAARNPHAWIQKAASPAEIVEPSASNRPVAFPYTKLMVANSSVNQGAAVIVTSLAEARAARVDESRLVFVGAGAAAHEPPSPLARARWDESEGMRVSLERALDANGLETRDLDHVELYSCFPCVPKLARRILGWPADRPATVHGGLTFGGGPIGNYMTHAIASMVLTLRAAGGTGLLFANGGYCTHNHTIVLTRTPPSSGLLPRDYDFQAEADARRAPIPPLTDEYEGPAPVETYTVLYDRSGAPEYGVVLARAPEGKRAIARVEPGDAASIGFLTDGEREPVGAVGRTERRDGRLCWRWQPGGAN